MEGDTAKEQTFEEAIDQILAGAGKLTAGCGDSGDRAVCYIHALDVAYNVWCRLSDSREKMEIGRGMLEKMMTPPIAQAARDPRLGRPPGQAPGGGPFGGHHGG